MVTDSPPANVVSVETTVHDDSEDIIIVAETKPKENRDITETNVEAKIERQAEQIAFFSVQQLLGGIKPGDCIHFRSTEAELPYPKDKSDYTAFARIKGENWQEASYVESITC